MRLFTTIVIVFLVHLNCLGQEMWLIDEDDGMMDLEFLGLLKAYEEEQLFINSASKNELLAFPFWDERIVRLIVFYRDQFNGFNEVDELKMIDGIEKADILLYGRYISCAFTEVKSKGKECNQFLNRNSCQKEITLDSSIFNDKWYLRNKGSVKGCKYSILFEKDYGEQWWSKRGVDHQSIYLEKHLGKLNSSIIVGDYKMSIGQGLGLRHGFSQFGKSGPIINGNYSANESQFFRGIALNGTNYSIPYVFYCSYKYLDGSLDENKIKLNPYENHTIISRIAQQNQVAESYIGGYIQLSERKWVSGLSIFRQDMWMRENNNIDSSLYFTGIDFAKRFGNVLFEGEVGLLNFKSFSFLNQVKIDLSDQICFNVLFKHVPIDYRLNYMNTVKASSAGVGEDLAKLSVNYNIDYNFTIKLNVQQVFYSKYRYQIDVPSQGGRFGFAVFKRWNDVHSIQYRYRVKRGLSNFNVAKDKMSHLAPVVKESCYLNYQYKYNDWGHKWQLQSNQIKSIQSTGASSLLFYYQLALKMAKLKWIFRYTWAYVPQSDLSFYIYENDVLYNYAFKSYYRTGESLFLMLKIQPNDSVHIWLKQGVSFNDLKQTYTSTIQLKWEL